jgi:hypothetical protein
MLVTAFRYMKNPGNSEQSTVHVVFTITTPAWQLEH